eukprot:763493-Hanusia_phi.AAC.1
MAQGLHGSNPLVRAPVQHSSEEIQPCSPHRHHAFKVPPFQSAYSGKQQATRWRAGKGGGEQVGEICEGKEKSQERSLDRLS